MSPTQKLSGANARVLATVIVLPLFTQFAVVVVDTVMLLPSATATTPDTVVVAPAGLLFALVVVLECEGVTLVHVNVVSVVGPAAQPLNVHVPAPLPVLVNVRVSGTLKYAGTLAVSVMVFPVPVVTAL